MMKKFWSIFKKVLVVQAWITVGMLFVFTLMSARRQQQNLVCSSIQVKIDYESGMSFLTTDEIVSKINSLAGGSAIGEPLPLLDFRTIEKGLLKDPFVEKARIYIDHQQVLHAEIVQKQPIMRVINNDGVGFYISDMNDKIPVSDRFTAHVPVAIGDVMIHENSDRDSIVLSQLCLLAHFMQQDSLTAALIDHVYVLPNGELEMYPKFGYHTIAFGRADETMKEKFDKLKIFYKEGLAKVGWDKYKIINLKFQGQVVCERSPKETVSAKENKDDKEKEKDDN